MPATVTMSADAILEGCETISYTLALAICDNVGLMFSFLAEYGERESWIADGNEIPVDAGELLTFINSNLYLVNNSK
jgi:hypothetical protein